MNVDKEAMRTVSIAYRTVLIFEEGKYLDIMQLVE